VTLFLHTRSAFVRLQQQRRGVIDDWFTSTARMLQSRLRGSTPEFCYITTSMTAILW